MSRKTAKTQTLTEWFALNAASAGENSVADFCGLKKPRKTLKAAKKEIRKNKWKKKLY
jgi:hypothetical protein